MIWIIKERLLLSIWILTACVFYLGTSFSKEKTTVAHVNVNSKDLKTLIEEVREIKSLLIHENKSIAESIRALEDVNVPQQYYDIKNKYKNMAEDWKKADYKVPADKKKMDELLDTTILFFEKNKPKE